MSDLQRARADIDLLTAALLELIDSAWAELTDAERKLVAAYLLLSPAQRTRRQRDLIRLSQRLMGVVQDAARREVAATLRDAFQAGVSRTAAAVGQAETVAPEDSDLLDAISRSTFDDVLGATRHVEQTTKELVRELGSRAAGERFSGGITAEQAGKQLAEELAEHAISAIVYKNGARHGLDDYANMLMRTKTAEVYQAGGFAQARDFGIRYMELLDGPSCGLSYHDDPTKANGLILPISEAEKYPISHPRCVRVTVPRVDIHTAEDARNARPSTTVEQDADQRLVEQTREAAAARRAKARQMRDRTTRDSEGLLTPSSGVAESPAARRAAARIKRAETRTGTTGGIPDEFKLGDTDSRALHGHDVDGEFQYDQDRLATVHDPYVNSRLAQGVRVDEPEFTVMGGGAASGKSSIIRSGDVNLPEGHVLVNADEAKEVIPEYVAGVQAGSKHAAAFVHEESSDMGKRLTHESLTSNFHTVLDGVGNGSIESLAGKIAKAREDGARRVVGEYVTVDTDEAVRRALKRAEGSGRYVPVDVIRHGHETVSKTFYDATQRPGLFDELRLWDNNGDAPRLIYQQVSGIETVLDQEAYEAFLRKSPKYGG